MSSKCHRNDRQLSREVPIELSWAASVLLIGSGHRTLIVNVLTMVSGRSGSRLVAG
jgi:hypothetical protein